MAGGSEDDSPADIRSSAEMVAAWVADFCASGYGPLGGSKLLVGTDLDVAASPAAALRDIPAQHPGFEPYRDLVRQVHASVGDGGTLAGLLCGSLVRRSIGASRDGVPIVAIISGLQLARRQSNAWLAAKSSRSTVGECLQAVADASWIEPVVAGLKQLGAQGTLDLDAIHIRSEDGPTWQSGVALDLHGEHPGLPAGRIMLLHEGPRIKPSTDTFSRISTAAAEDAIVTSWLAQLKRLDVGVLCVAKGLGDLRDRVAQRILVADDVTQSLTKRIELATGAKLATNLGQIEADDLGVAEVTKLPRRVGGWVLQGAGPGATFNVGRQSGQLGNLRADLAERFLRAAGAVIKDSRKLPGGGQWQRELAKSLRAAADAAPGRSSFGVKIAGEAFNDCLWALLRNAGQDPLDGGTLPAINDASVCAEAAVDSAFEVAIAILRVDGAYAKKSSSGVDLRGGTGKMGSPKGMPGDIPPLM